MLLIFELESTAGSILFGAVDKTKYRGPLKAAPIVEGPSRTDVVRTAIQMTSFTLNDKSGDSPMISNDTVAWTVLDTGATFSQFPPFLTKPFFAAAGVVANEMTGPYGFVACNLSTADANFTFGFGGTDGPQISVPMSQLVLPWQYNLTFADGSEACVIGVSPATTPMVTLGDTFLRSAYSVFDLENKRIALAQSVSNVVDPQKGNIESITEGEDGIPDLDSQASAIPWPQSYIDAYASAIPNISAATTSAVLAPTQAPSPATQMENIQFPFLPPKASFTAERAVGPSSTGTQTQGSDSAGIMDLKVTAGVLCLGFTMAAATMIVEIFAL